MEELSEVYPQSQVTLLEVKNWPVCLPGTLGTHPGDLVCSEAVPLPRRAGLGNLLPYLHLFILFVPRGAGDILSSPKDHKPTVVSRQLFSGPGNSGSGRLAQGISEG